MEGCGINTYDQSEFLSLYSHILDGDYIDYINSWFEPKTADTLIKGISLDSNHPELGLKEEDAIIDFLDNYNSKVVPDMEVSSGFKVQMESDDDTTSLTAYAAFTKTGGTRTEFEDQIVNVFKTEIIERTLLNNGQLVDPAKVNENLYNYKLELLSHLYEFVAPDKELPVFESNEQFTRFMKAVIAQFNRLSNNGTAIESKTYVPDYIILSNFDKFLTDEIDYISIKPEYLRTNTSGQDMYISSGPFNYKDRFSTYSEEAGTEDYTSSFVKLLLWYFKSNGKPIGLDGFQGVSGEVMAWAEDTGDISLQEALYQGLDYTVDPKKAGKTIKGIEYLLDRFVKEAKVTPTVRNLASAIKDQIFKSEGNPLDSKIRQIFANQFITSVRYSYLAYRLKYDTDSKEIGTNAMRFVSELLQSELVNKQVYRIQRTAKNRVYQLRHNPNLFQNLVDKYNIKIVQDGIEIHYPKMYKSGYPPKPYKITITKNDPDIANSTYAFTSKTTGVDGNYNSGAISDEFVKEFIQDVTGLLLPEDMIEVWNISNPTSGSLWDNFFQIAAIVLSASAKAENGENLFNGYQYLYQGDELKLYKYYRTFEPLGNFYSVVNGTELATVIKNAEGNNLPTSQLRTSVFDVKRELYNINRNKGSERSNIRILVNGKWTDQKASSVVNVFGENIFKKWPTAIGTIAMRSDTKIEEQSRIATELLPAEVVQEAIGVDFYTSLKGDNALQKSRRKTGKMLPTDVSVWMQPIVYSDKRTHFVVEFKLNKIFIKGVGLNTILNGISSFATSRDSSVKAIENELQRIRLDKYTKQAENLISRFNVALDWHLERRDGEDILSYFNRARQKLHEFCQINGTNAEAKLKDAFGEKADLYVSDYEVAKTGEIFFNPTLYNQLRTNSDSHLFNRRIKAQKINFIRDLIDIGFTMDPAVNTNWRSVYDEYNDNNPTWFDSYDHSMKLFKATLNGKPINIDWTNIDDLDLNTIEFELNPILESYFYADIFLCGQFSDLIFGDINGYTAKHGTYKLNNEGDLIIGEDGSYANELFYIEDESSRLADMAKRTVMAGASRISFAQGMKYGISDHIKIANFKDIGVNVFNFLGTKDVFKGQDGSAFTHPIFSRQQNVSLLDRRMGNQKKKTFCNWLDRETGTAGELKFAEFVITNEMRRMSSEISDFSFENLYKHMSEIIADSLATVDFTKYYNPSGNNSFTNEEGENITCTTPIYRYNLDTLLYERLIEIRKNGDLTQSVWQAYTDDNVPIEGAITEDPEIKIDTIWKLDQLFGGAYCSIWNSDTNRFEWSEINQDLMSIIVAEENLKDSFIALAANVSATKIGARNVNDLETLQYNYTDKLKYFEISTLHYGPQMNPDHEIDDSNGGVREMSQMISALVQNGYLTGDVNEIYQMIGNVALDSVRTVIKAVDEKDQDKIYQIVGQALIKAFDTNQKSVLGLAQSFIAIANEDLENGSFKTRIPFSANTIKGSFQATITSFLNKDAIRRRYSGMGGVQTPSHGIVQYYPYNGENLTWLEFVKAMKGKRNAIQALTNKTWNGVQFENPFIREVKNHLDLKLGDTIVYLQDGNVITQKLSTPELLYQYKYNSNLKLYNWTIRPRDLAESEIIYSVNGQRFSIYDSDLVRIISELKAFDESFYQVIIDPITNKKAYVPSERGAQLFNMLRNSLTEKVITFDSLLDPNVRFELFQLAKWDIQNKLLPELSSIYKGETTQMHIQECMKPKTLIDQWKDTSKTLIEATVENMQTIQVGIGKLNARKMGLEKGDTLNDVKRQGPKFFEKKLERFTVKPSNIDPNLYDAVLYEEDGTPTLVMFGGLRANSERLNNTVINSTYKKLGNEYWKNGKSYGDASGKYFKAYIDENGKTWDIVIVDSIDDYQTLKYNGGYVNDVINYTTSNWQSLLKYRFKHNFNDGVLTKSIWNDSETNRPLIEQTPDGDLYSVFDDAFTADKLNSFERFRQKRFRQSRAIQQNEAFNLQLKLIIDRIPSQSMQSFTSADVVLLLDTDENALLFSAFLAWLQGSDFDVDKGFIMSYEIKDDGSIATPSRLDRFYLASDVLDLPLPNRQKFNFYTTEQWKQSDNTSDFLAITLDLVPERIPIETIRLILSGSHNIVFSKEFDSPEFIDRKNKLIDLINIHQNSVDMPSDQKVSGYRNRIVHRIHSMLRDPIVQANMNIPVDEAMNELKDVIPEPKYKSELYRTWDNPMAKFRLQYDNMVGRAVIGISAVSLKGFFALSDYGNTIILNLINKVQKYKSELILTGNPNIELGNDIIRDLQKICFDTKFLPDSNIGTNIATIANLRFTELLQLVGDNLQIVYSIPIRTNRLSSISNYDNNGVLNLSQLIKDLNVFANGTYMNPKNAALVLSGYTSLATDNAKELKLVKMNATSKFADLHTLLAITGMQPKDVVSFMASKAFNLITRFAEPSILTPDSNRYTVENALSFILDEQTLPSMNNHIFEQILSTYDESDDKSIFKKGKLTTEELYRIIINSGFNDPRMVRLTPSSEQDLREIIKSMSTKNTSLLVKGIYKTLHESENLQEVLLNTLRYGVVNTESSFSNEMDPELLLESEFSIEDVVDESFYEDDLYYDSSNYFETWELTKEDWLQAYRYVKNQLLPKNAAYDKLTIDDIQRYELLKSVIKAAKELQMLGSLLGINTGMDTNDFAEYNNVKKIEKFVNKKYMDYSKQYNETLIPLDFIKFLDKNETQYRIDQIKQYDKVAEVVNILETIVSIPHFNAMLQMIPLNRYLLSRSVALSMERELADKVLAADKPIEKGFTYGDSQALNKKEWSILRNYVNDLLIYKWFEQQDFSIKLPKEAYYYDGGNEVPNKIVVDLQGTTEPRREEIKLNNLDGLATFKRLMDDYIIPDLKKAFPDNYFLQDILLGNIHNNDLEKLQTFYCPSFDVSEASKNAALGLKYKQMSEAFNKIASQKLPVQLSKKYGDWRIGDLFFLYNLYVHKDGFGSQSFTRLFEDSNTSADKFVYSKQYYTYLATLDARKLDYRQLFAWELGLNSIPGTNTSYEYLYDLKIRLASVPNAMYRFRMESNGTGTDYTLKGQLANGDPITKTLFDPKLNPSDYTLWFPYSILNKGFVDYKSKKEESLVVKQGDELIGDISSNAVSRIVLDTIIDRLSEILGNTIAIKSITTLDLTAMWKNNTGDIKFKDLEDFNRTSTAKAFIYNGTIYINTQNASIDDPVHELLHIVLAAMRNNNDPQIRAKYYSLLNNVIATEEGQRLYKAYQERYNGRKDSDIKEEAFVKYLSNGFATMFNDQLESWANARENITNRDLIEFVRNTFSELFGTEIEDLSNLEFGNTTLRTLLSIFGTSLPGMNRTDISETILPENERIRTIKTELINSKDTKNKITYSKDCL